MTDPAPSEIVQPPGSDQEPFFRLWTFAVALPVGYAIFGVVWILASDLLLESMHLPAEINTRVAVTKGWIYVALSTLIIALLIRHFWVVIDRMFDALRQQLSETIRARKEADHLAESLEQMVEERTRHLEIALAELGHFTDSVSHDLRAPIRTLAGFSRILLEDHGESFSEEQCRIVSRIELAAVRMNHMVDGLLDLSRCGRDSLELVELDGPAVDRMVAEIWIELRNQSPERALEARFSELSGVRCDPRLFENIWRNLLGNAIKYSRGRSPGIVEVWFADGWYHVRDNGVGFDPQRFRDIFLPFRRYHSNEEYEGDGIGLALVHRIVKRHGGEIVAESQEGEGATFRFRFS